MELGGVLGFDGLVGSSSSSSSVFPSSPLERQPMNQKGLFLKHGRSDAPHEQQQDDEWSRSLKLSKAEAKEAPFLLRSSDGEQMLSFSSSKPNATVISSDGSLPFYHQTHYYPSYSSSPSSAAYFYRNAGMVAGSANVSMHGAMAGFRGPFTPSQWLELEHQALIYKYIDAKAPIPSNLLIPFRRSLNPSGLSNYLPGSFRSSAYGWGSFHLGFPGSADPEPGRCRRTDGKKWRCSRDAVADQKYCERHINRGRHRSRKLVEGRSGHASKPVPAITTPQSAAAGCVGTTNGLSFAQQQQNKSLQSNAVDPSPSQFNRILMSKENINDRIHDSEDLSALTRASPKPANSLFPVSKLHDPFEGTLSETDFGLVSADSLLNPSRTSYPDNISFDDDGHSQTQPLRHFIDDWPKSHSERTQLSISIPTDFSSSSNSPIREKLALSPLRLSREFDAINEGNERHTRNWVPISWEPTVGGPLGEVLNNTNSTPKGLSKNCSSSSLNLLTDGWDSSPRLGAEASPTGVLQKTTFGSLSSSSGSSPRANNQCDDLGSNLVDPPSTVPSL